jgi:hypothetical protein
VARKLWKVEIGDYEGGIQMAARPESKAKAYDIYVANAAGVYDYAEVWVDERDGRGWQLYERINLADYGKEG